MSVTVREYEARDFLTLYRLDQSCFPPGVAYSRTMLRYFLNQPGADCLVAEDGGHIVGFILAEQNPPLAHIITLDVAEGHRKKGLGTILVLEMEKHFHYQKVRTVLLETSVENSAGIAFWERHGYRTEARLQRYYLNRIDAYEMRKLLPGSQKSVPAQKDL
ncbi:MAG TPA: N-acetyltransferase [Candidatus Dormibacteraeota bacterium]|nr:N-acetyltransferase [Candidatus Dormibacteraeota bacterium]